MKIVYIDMDDTLCDFDTAFKRSKLEHPDITWPQSRHGFFLNLQPIDGAIEAVNELIVSNKYDPYILSSPSVRNPTCYAEKRVWIENYFGLEFCKKLILSPNKGLNHGEYLIDDNVEGKGQDAFKGELIHFGGDEYPTWEHVISYLQV